MAFTITAFKFSKRSNSTAQPSGSGTDFSVSLKDACTYDNPVFLLNFTGTFDYNYIMWGSWYYFVSDVTIERNNLLSIRCDLDVLATYKTQIGATSAFVLYDTAANTEIPDRRLSTKTTVTYSIAYAPASFDMFEAAQSIVVGIVGQNSTNHWIMDSATARSLLAGLDNWMNNISLKWPAYDSGEDDGNGEPGSNDDDSGNGPGV